MSESLTDKLAAYFAARPLTWIDGKELATVAGGYGWRTRVSDVRKSGMVIQNRQRRVSITVDGELDVFVRSEYRYVPAETQPTTSGPHNLNAAWTLR